MTKITRTVSNYTVHGSVLATQKIENCLNSMLTRLSDTEFKPLLTNMLNQISDLNSRVPAEKSQAIKQLSREAEDLVSEIISPRKRNTLFSLVGIKDAAIKLGETAARSSRLPKKSARSYKN